MERMEQRISLITLGVADLRRAMDFYAALGWEGSSPDGDVAFFQAGGMVFGLWGRDKLAADSAVEDRGGWGGDDPRPLRPLAGRGRRRPRAGRRRGRDDRRGRREDVLGRLLRALRRPRRARLGGRPQPGLDARTTTGRSRSRRRARRACARRARRSSRVMPGPRSRRPPRRGAARPATRAERARKRTMRASVCAPSDGWLEARRSWRPAPTAEGARASAARATSPGGVATGVGMPGRGRARSHDPGPGAPSAPGGAGRRGPRVDAPVAQHVGGTPGAAAGGAGEAEAGHGGARAAPSATRALRPGRGPAAADDHVDGRRGQ